MGAGKIDVYMDIVSMYGYLAFLDLRRNKETLAAHGVEVEFHPVLLGAINAGSGNRPPWMLPAKAKYGTYDAKRSIARFPGLVVSFPKDLMAVSKTTVPNRALHVIKRSYPRETFETTLYYFLYSMWSPPNANMSLAENVAKALSEVTVGFNGSVDPSAPKLFTPEQVKSIMQAAGSDEAKEALTKATQEALKRGAFGNPWMWVTNSEGKGEPFFGSDRFHFVYKFLGLPFQDVTLLPPSNDGKPKLWSKL